MTIQRFRGRCIAVLEQRNRNYGQGKTRKIPA